MEIIPLIGGSKTGPLGIMHLPRLWFKLRAHAVEALPEGYRHGTGGSDGDLYETFGIDGDAFGAYIAAEAPDYQACEGWVRANAAAATPETIRVFNEKIVNFVMPDPRRSEWTARFGLADDAFVRAVQLNQLDDWDLIHRQLLESTSTEPVVPALSTSMLGPLGVAHLARLWLKHRLHGAGRLPEGYRHGAGGFDEMMTTAIGLDPVAFATYVEAEQADYLNAEAWVRAHATKLTPPDIAAWNERLSTALMPDHLIAGRHAELGITDPDFKAGIPLNDLDDWLGLHRQLLAAR